MRQNPVYRIIRENLDLVVLDILLPGMNGCQICHTVRHDYPGKILMLTALDDVQSEVELLNLGADDYLTKPVSEQKLLARIYALLRRPSLAFNDDVLTVGRLSLQLNKQAIQLNGHAISISASDFELLALLVKNKGRCLSRDSICFSLYGREYDGVDRGIDLKISRLRKALYDDDAKKIKTIHGKGYVFIKDAW